MHTRYAAGKGLAASPVAFNDPVAETSSGSAGAGIRSPASSRPGIVRGGPALRLRHRNGGVTLVSLPQAEEAAALLRSWRARSQPTTP